MGIPVPVFANDTYDSLSELNEKVAYLVQRTQNLIESTKELELQVTQLENELNIQQHSSSRNEQQRPDMDMVAVRASRHLLNRIQNDHKELVADIEQALRTLDETTRQVNHLERQHELEQLTAGSAFAIVCAVSPGSPASEAGLCKDDRLVRVGHVHAGNHEHLTAVNQLVRQSEGIPLQIELLRGQNLVSILTTAVPRRRALGDQNCSLGCHIRPI